MRRFRVAERRILLGVLAVRLPLTLVLLSILWLCGQPSVAQGADEFPAFATAAESSGELASDGGNFLGPLMTSGSALVVVLAVFGALVWVQRRFGAPRQELVGIPESVIERMGTIEIDSRMQATLLKFGDRLLLIGQSTSGQMQTLAELTDPDEVARMTNRCLGRPEIVGRRTTPRRNVAAG